MFNCWCQDTPNIPRQTAGIQTKYEIAVGIKIKQHDITDCGAACLASIAAFYKLRMPIARIRQIAGTDRKGTTILGLLEAAHKLGFEAKGVRGNMESLEKVPKPAILHLVLREHLQHFVVLYRITKKKVLVMDPADGKMHHMEREVFHSLWTGVMVLLMPDEHFKAGNEQIPVLKRFWFLLKPHTYILLQAFAGAVVYTLLGFSTAIYIQKLTDFVFIGGNTNLLNLMSVIMVVLLLLQTIIASFKDIYLIRTGQLIDLRLILGYYRHLLKLPQQFFDAMQVGELLSRINDAVKIRAFINGVSLSLMVNLMIVAFSFLLMFTLYWKLALIMLLMLPAYATIYILVNRWNRKTERAVMESSAGLESQLVESLATIKTLKYYALEDFTGIQTETRFVALLYKTYKSALNNIFSINGTFFISALFTIVLLWSGSYFVIRKAITPGQLMSFYTILGYFTAPVSRLIGANKEMQNALIAADRLFEIMDLEREASETRMTLKKESIGDIRFHNVAFRYGARVHVFNGLNLNIPKGKITALVGESGSGKSTLMHLLQRLYPVQKGSIRIGKKDIKYVNAENLRGLIGVVPQKIDLFAGNIIQNIAVGTFAPDVERIQEICSTIGIMPFIEALPHGFDTYLGENGAMLSGGQKQRIAIARALYREPEILILDEATSSLDSTAENFVQKAVQHLKLEKKTVVMIAHRLSTVIDADKIVVLHQGKVLEEGTHDFLYRHKGYYYKLWRQQMPLTVHGRAMN